jgi:hypothetical protein
VATFSLLRSLAPAADDVHLAVRWFAGLTLEARREFREVARDDLGLAGDLAYDLGGENVYAADLLSLTGRTCRWELRTSRGAYHYRGTVRAWTPKGVYVAEGKGPERFLSYEEFAEFNCY